MDPTFQGIQNGKLILGTRVLALLSPTCIITVIVGIWLFANNDLDIMSSLCCKITKLWVTHPGTIAPNCCFNYRFVNYISTGLGTWLKKNSEHGFITRFLRAVVSATQIKECHIIKYHSENCNIKNTTTTSKTTTKLLTCNLVMIYSKVIPKIIQIMKVAKIFNYPGPNHRASHYDHFLPNTSRFYTTLSSHSS